MTRMTCRRILLLLAGVALTACGGSAPSLAPTITSFDATPTTVLAGGTTTLSWTVSGDAPLVLELTPDIGDVSGSNTRQVSPTATTTYTLTATNDVGSHSATLTLTVRPVVDLRGTVIGMNGHPASGIEILVHAGERRPLSTGGDGTFDAGDVATPYDVTVHDVAAEHSVTYVGLTLEEPTLLMLGTTPGPQHQTVVQGQVTGGFGYPEPADGWTQVAFGSDDTRIDRRADATTGDFAIDPLAWFGPLRTEGRLHALQWRAGPSGLPASYSGYVQQPISLESTVPVHAGQTLNVVPVDEGVVSGVTPVPPGYAPLARTLSIQFDDGASIVVATEPGFSEGFSYRTPHVGDGDPTLAAMAIGPSDSGGYAVLPDLPHATSGVELAVPVASSLNAPADGVAGVDTTTEFRWSSPVKRAHLVRFRSSSGPDVDVVTAASEATLPDLDPLGAALAPATSYTWRVFGLEPYANVDAVANTEDAFLSAWFYSPFFAPVRPAKVSQSSQRSFTTAP
jgi:hypothetical protein